MPEMPEMPALPEPFDTMAALQGASIDSTLRCEIVEVPVYTADQMQAYAAAAVAAEREAIIALLPGGDHVDPQWVADAIRARGM
jgi:hypothetical protein